MPEILAALAPAFFEGAAEFAGAVGPEVAGAAASGFGAAAPELAGAGAGMLGSFGEMSAAGLPFGAGVGELGSVATGLGSSGVSPFIEALAALGGAGGGLGGAGGLAGLGAGAGEVGMNIAGVGAELGGLGSPVFPGTEMLTAGTGLPETAGGFSTSGMNTPPGGSSIETPSVTPAGGVTNIGPTAGTPPGAISQGSFAPPTGASASAVAPPAGVSSGIDLTSMLKYAGPAVAAAGLGYNIFQGQKETATTGAIKGQSEKVAANAAELMGQGKQLTSHLESGTLPPNIQAKLDEDTKAAKTKIISNYASQGMNTDPNKNSSLRQELASVDRQAKVVSGQLAQQLAQSGTNLISAGTQLTGLDNTLLTTLSNIDTTQTARVGTAIANFAAALNGNKGGTTIQIGGTTK